MHNYPESALIVVLHRSSGRYVEFALVRPLRKPDCLASRPYLRCIGVTMRSRGDVDSFACLYRQSARGLLRH